MASLRLYDGILSELLDACRIGSNADEPLPQRSGGSPILRYHIPTSLEETSCCDLTIRLREPNEMNPAVSPSCWTSSYHQVTIELSGQTEGINLSASEEHSQVLLYDFCRFVFHCLKKCKIAEVKIRTNLSLVETIFGLPNQQKYPVSKKFLISTFVFTHLIRVSGEQLISVSEEAGGSLTLKIGDRPRFPLRSLSYTCGAEKDLNFAEDLLDFLITSSGPSYLCFLFDELDTCNWYLKVKGQHNQHDRLPNHDTSLIEIKGDINILNIHVTAFDYYEDKYCNFKMELDGSAPFLPNRFKNDELLLTVVQLVQKFIMENKITEIHLFCLTVPCRTTLKWLELVSSTPCELSSRMIGNQTVRSNTEQSGENLQLLSVTNDICGSAAHGNIEEMGQFISLNPLLIHFKQQDFPHRSALLCAAAASADDFSQGTVSHTQCFQTLILKGADVGERDSRGHSVLHCAVLSNNGDLVEWLLQESSADPSCRDEDGQTPLVLAVEEENLQIAKVFLQHGTNLSMEPDGTYLELTRAISLENVELVELLLDYQPNAVSDAQFPKYYWKAWKQDAKEICCLLLLRKYGLAEEAVEEAAQLGDLASQSCTEQLRKQLNIHNCNFRDWDCRTPLMWAAIGSCDPTEGHAECAKLLLSLGADHSTSDLDGNSALHLAAASGSLSVTALLLQHGASVQTVNHRGDKPADVAEQRGQLDVGVILRTAETCPMISPATGLKSSLQSDSNFWDTAIKAAATKGRLLAVKFCIAQLQNTEKAAEAILHAAVCSATNGHLEIAKHVLSTITDSWLKYKCCSESAKAAALMGHLKVAEYLIQQISDQSLRDQCCSDSAKAAAGSKYSNSPINDRIFIKMIVRAIL